MKIFLSYGHDDHQELAEIITKDLSNLGHEVWIDNKGIQPKHDWEISIEKGITTSDCVVVLMTPHSMRRPDGVCLDELSFARFQGKPITPIMVQSVQPPLCIARIQWLDMRSYKESSIYKKQFEKLIEVINGEFLLGFEGEQSYLKGILKPLNNDSEILLHTKQYVGRKWLMEEYDRWLTEDLRSPVFWVKGKAGMGKTAFAAMLAHTKSSVVGVHFCKYYDSDRSDPKKIILSLAYSLSTQLQEYAKQLSALIDIKSLYEKNTNSLFHYLIVEPFMDIVPPNERHVLLIDALDEVSSDELVTAIAENVDKLPNWLAFVVTSRNDAMIERILSRFNPKVIEANDVRNTEDIRQFLNKVLSFSSELLTETILQKLLQKSEGNFLYVKEIVRELEAGTLQIEDIDVFPQGLTQIYHRNFKRLFPNIKSYKQQYRPLFELMIASMEPLSLRTAVEILNWDEYEKEEMIEPLTALFKIENETITPIHKSLLDWITDRKKSGDYYASPKIGNEKLTNFIIREYRNTPKHLSSYTLTYLLEHLIKIEDWDLYTECLMNPNFINQKVEKGYLEETVRNVREQHSNININKLGDYFQITVFKNLDSFDSGFLEFTAEILLMFCDVHMALEIYKKLFNQAIQKNENEKLPYYLSRIGDIYVILRHYQESLSFYEQAVKIAMELNNFKSVIEIYLSQAHVYKRILYNSEVFKLYNEAVYWSEKIENNQLLGRALYEFSIYLLEFNSKKANELFKKTKTVFQESNNLEELLSRYIKNLQRLVKRNAHELSVDYLIKWCYSLAEELNDKEVLKYLNGMMN